VGPRGAYTAAGISSLIGGAILFPALWGRRSAPAAAPDASAGEADVAPA
jgi:hypothetical protein